MLSRLPLLHERRSLETDGDRFNGIGAPVAKVDWRGMVEVALLRLLSVRGPAQLMAWVVSRVLKQKKGKQIERGKHVVHFSASANHKAQRIEKLLSL